MGFTRSTEDISVHQKLGDYPNQDDGLTPEELKKRYDKPAEILQKDLNNLEVELEELHAASKIGAEPIDGNDTTPANIQAKLIRLYEQLQNVVFNQIPDGTITKAKLSTDYSGVIAEKTGEVQTNLNAEMVGGITANQINQMQVVTGTYVGDGNTTRIIDLGFTPKAVLIQKQKPSTYNGVALGPHEGGLALANSPVYGATTDYICVGVTENGFKVGVYVNKNTNIYYNRSNIENARYNYIVWR